MRVFALVPLLISTSVHSAEPGEPYAVAEALLLYEAHSSPASLEGNLCITVEGKAISEAFSERLKNANLHIVPCGGASLVTRIPIGKPELQPDGNYQVAFGYYLDCGDNCDTGAGQLMFAFVRNDSTGWHIIRVQGGVHF